MQEEQDEQVQQGEQQEEALGPAPTQDGTPPLSVACARALYQLL